jgi:hypothetical protein
MPSLSLRDRLVAEGWFVNITRWTDGWQVAAYWPSHPARFGAHSGWFRSEEEAWHHLSPAVERLRAEVAERERTSHAEPSSLEG